MMVWNEKQVAEATNLHFMPLTNIFCTGAPKFDPWFDFKPRISEKIFCEQVGLIPKRPYLLYICSSEFITGDETVFVNQLARKLKKIPMLKQMSILVRPHPQNLKPWIQNPSIFIILFIIVVL